MNDKGKLKSPSLVSKQLKIVRATKLSNKNKAKIIMRPATFSDTAPCTLVISIVLNKTRTARINGTKQAFASYFRRDLHKTRLILEQNFWLFLFCPRIK